MKRITLAPDIKLSALLAGGGRNRVVVNGGTYGTRWLVCLQRGAETAYVPYHRGNGLSNSRGIDLTAALKAIMVEQTMLILYPGQAERDSLSALRGMKPEHWTRIERTKRELVRVMGDEYPRILDIILHNMVELANVA